MAVEKSFPRGSRLMSEGDQANYVMVIRSGWTQITVRDNDGERVVAERGPGSSSASAPRFGGTSAPRP